jgi:hypothetical protein
MHSSALPGNVHHAEYRQIQFPPRMQLHLHGQQDTPVVLCPPRERGNPSDEAQARKHREPSRIFVWHPPQSWF